MCVQGGIAPAFPLEMKNCTNFYVKFEHFWKCTPPEMYPLTSFQISKYVTGVDDH